MFIETLKKVVNDEFPKREFEREADKYIKVQILNNIAVYFLDQSTKENDKKKK